MENSKIIKLNVSLLSNIYLLPCIGGYLQIDTAYKWNYEDYIKELNRNEISIKEIRYLFLTHHHDDHCGFANKLKEASNCFVLATEQTYELMKIGKNDLGHGGGFINSRVKFFASLLKIFDRRWDLCYSPYHKQENDQVTSEDSSLLKSICIEGQILFTPGHTIDHQVIILKNGKVFCGDAASSAFNLSGAKYCTAFMTNMSESYKSWKKMINHGGKCFYPAHGHKFNKIKLERNLDHYSNQDLKPLGALFD